MAKIDYEKVKKLHLKGLKVPEIAKLLKCSPGTIHNNKDKWYVERVEEGKAEEAEPAEQIQPVVNPIQQVLSNISEREHTRVREFYKERMKKVRVRIKELMESETNEDTYKELQLLEKLLKVLRESKQIDFEIHDILSYKDLTDLDMAIKRFELDIIKARQGADNAL